MENLPLYLPVIFVLITIATLLLLYRATGWNKMTLLVLLVWLILQAVIGLSGFYTDTKAFPPRLMLLILPPIVLIAGLFISKRGRRFINGMDIRTLTLLHTIRVGVELVLLGLYMHNAVPKLMTFEGRNFDVLSGLTAPLVYYLCFVKKVVSNRWLLGWNIVCLGLLINIVVNAIMAAPTPFQRFGLDQPNVGILYFPFVWLPCFVVPLVLLAHLVAIRQLIQKSA